MPPADFPEYPLKENVYISEKSINEALKWFQGNVSTLMESMNK